MEGMNFAAIDIGTNAARLLIKNIDHNPLGETKFRKVLFIRYPLRLGMDVFSKGKIGKERAEMMMHMIKGFKQMMRMYDVVDYRACATSAMRDAKNGKALIKKIEKKTGIRIDLIEGKEEAGILYGNHIEKLPNKEGTFMYVDVGGGSTEITLIHQGRLVGSMSYNIGTIRLLNRAVKDGIVDGLKADMAGMYANYGPINIIGSGGNINKLFRLAEEKSKKELKLPITSLRSLHNDLQPLSVEERMDRFGLKPDRADVIVPAAEIFLIIADCIHSDYVYVPTIGLAGGIIGNQNNSTNSDWTIRYCANYGMVYCYHTHYSGGIMGQWTGTGGTIEYCRNYSSLQTTYTVSWFGASGGIVAQLYHASENNEYNIIGCGNYGSVYRMNGSGGSGANDSAGCWMRQASFLRRDLSISMSTLQEAEEKEASIRGRRSFSFQSW